MNLKFFCWSVVFTLLTASVVEAQIESPFTGNKTVTWEEAIQEYTQLATSHDWATLQTVGFTDVGRPLHVFIIDKEGDEKQLTDGRTVLLINNGIHPGESCGIDASIKLSKNLLSGDQRFSSFLDSVIVAIIPIYNVGGALNRNCCVRANQNGPEEYGFRGNAKNLDLNRDFIKCDSKNAKSFTRLFHALKPHVFLDTHTSDGADFQYVMTMIATQPDKASEQIGSYMRNTMNPALYRQMKASPWQMTPYVYTLNQVPENGIRDFIETPRFSTGFAALFNTIGYTSESHMLKPYAQRVESTYQFQIELLQYMHANNTELIQLKEKADEATRIQTTFALDWEMDTTQYRMIPFKGFEPVYEKSKVTGGERLRYDQSRPYEKEIKYYDKIKTIQSVEAPSAYIVPQAWEKAIERLKLNQVDMQRITSDTTMVLGVYYVREFSAASDPYEGHYYNTVEDLTYTEEEVKLYKGDYLIQVNQVCNRYIIETLEPRGVDSFFRWNFFDSAMQQKEWYSSFIFEDTAENLLKNNPALREEFESKKESDPEFAASAGSQLYWLYRRSPNYEGTANRYPVFRVLN